MKKHLYLALFLFNIAFSQQFPVGAFRIIWDYPSHTPPLPSPTQQVNTIFPLLQDAYFNCGITFTHFSTSSFITGTVLPAANNHGINIILPAVVDTYADVERFYLAGGSSQYFNTVTGNIVDDNDAEVPFDLQSNPYYVKQSRKATIPSEYVVRDAKYSPLHL